MSGRDRRWWCPGGALVLVVLVVLVLLGMLGALGTVPAGATPADDPDDRTRCEELAARTEGFGARVEPSALTWQGRAIPLTARALASTRLATPQESLWFHSLAWLLPLLDTDPSAVVQVVERYTAALPDPGPDAGKGVRRATGWTEGQIRRRLETLECLYRRSASPVIAAAARELGDALLDDRRYYGLPLFRPHNHGAQANVLLARTGPLFDRPAWVATARERVLRDREAAFAECGMNDEQSAAYQWLNVTLWERLAQYVDVPVDPAPRRAAEALVRPDGVVEAIGGGRARTGREPGGDLWCPDLGWAAGTRDGMHYVVRFGPRAQRHGHRDHGAVTWFTHGVPVLVDRGAAPKGDVTALAWAESAAAHSTLERVGAEANTAMTGRRLGPDAYLLREQGGDAQLRTVRIGPQAVAVADRARTTSADASWIQHWHFAPGWTPVRDATGVITGDLARDDGSRVRLVCRDGGRAIVPTPVRVTSYAESGPQAAWDMQCRSRGPSVAYDSTLSWIGAGRTAGMSS